MAFLANLSDDQKRAALAAIPQARTREIIRRQVQGMDVSGMTFDEALAASGADFRHERVQMTVASGSAAGRPVRGHMAIVNPRTQQACAVASETFGVIDHIDALAPMRPVLERGDAALVGIDMRDGGARFEGTALLGFDAVQRAGIDQPDALAAFWRISNAHDGSSRLVSALSLFRLRCDNGMGYRQLLQREALRHTSRVSNRMIDFGRSVRDLLDLAQAEVETFQGLADQSMSAADFVEFASTWLIEIRGDVPAQRDGESDRDFAKRTAKVTDKRDDELAELLGLFNGETGTRSNLGRDRYDALNSVTEWLTPRRAQYRDVARYVSAAYSAETGARAKQRERALRLLTR